LSFNEASAVVPIPTLFMVLMPTLSTAQVPAAPTAPAGVPLNLPVEESYVRTYPSVLAVVLSTSSRNSRRTSPPPPRDESCC